MKGLLIKDFKLLKVQKNFFLLILCITIGMEIFTNSASSSFIIGFLSFVATLFTLSSISYDEFDNGNAFLFSLPITRKSYVTEIWIWHDNGKQLLGIWNINCDSQRNNCNEICIHRHNNGSFYHFTYCVFSFSDYAAVPIKVWRRKRTNCNHLYFGHRISDGYCHNKSFKCIPYQFKLPLPSNSHAQSSSSHSCYYWFYNSHALYLLPY